MWKDKKAQSKPELKVTTEGGWIEAVKGRRNRSEICMTGSEWRERWAVGRVGWALFNFYCQKPKKTLEESLEAALGEYSRKFKRGWEEKAVQELSKDEERTEERKQKNETQALHFREEKKKQLRCRRRKYVKVLSPQNKPKDPEWN